MAAMPSTNDIAAHGAELLAVARLAIVHGVEFAAAPSLRSEDYAPPLREPGACFVTLHLDDGLRGCMGNLRAQQALVLDAADNAFASAFRDPRFDEVSALELHRLHIEISVLTPPQAIACASERELLATLRPGEDGLILRAGPQRSTFLPSVWEQLPEPADFLAELKRKAGLAPDYWSADVEVLRYGTISVAE